MSLSFLSRPPPPFPGLCELGRRLSIGLLALAWLCLQLDSSSLCSHKKRGSGFSLAAASPGKGVGVGPPSSSHSVSVRAGTANVASASPGTHAECRGGWRALCFCLCACFVASLEASQLKSEQVAAVPDSPGPPHTLRKNVLQKFEREGPGVRKKVLLERYFLARLSSSISS